MIKKIYISWRKNIGDRRLLIAMLKRSSSAKVLSFEYFKDYEEAKKQGLGEAFGFGSQADKLESDDIGQLITHRIVSKDKADKDPFLDFWEAKNKNIDDFIVLALTQGKSPTDSFEFLADYSFTRRKNIKFVTDIAGISHQKLNKEDVKEGDVLNYKIEPDNKNDKNAVVVYNGNKKIGYIKKIHNKVFFRYPNLKITVKAIDSNGTIRQVFLKVEG